MIHDGVIEWLAGLFPVLSGSGSCQVTVMFTDIEGFSTWAATRGDRAALVLLRHHDSAVLPALRQHRGRIVKRLGDGLMIVFSAAADALAAALAMQRAARRRATVRLRIGIHAGEARLRDGDLVGHDVNVAWRIAERAGGGQILVSGGVREAAVALPASFRRTRPLVLAGATRVPLFAVGDPQLASRA